MISKEVRPWDDPANQMEFSPVYDAEQPLFTFLHTYNNTRERIQVNKRTIETSESGDFVRFKIISEAGVLLGFTEGFLIAQSNQVLFEADTSMNLQRERGKILDYEDQNVLIPRVVGAAIGQLVKQGVINVWYSSYALESLGIKMYEEFLAKDPDLQITPYKFDGGNGYIVTTKQ